MSDTVDTESLWLDTAGVAELLGIKPASVRMARWRGGLPEPDLVVSGRPAWRRHTITTWLADPTHDRRRAAWRYARRAASEREKRP